MTHLPQQSHLKTRETFGTVTGKADHKPNKPKRAAPFCLRLSADERAQLERAAGDMPLGAYIRAKLFEHDLKPRRVRGRTPVKDHAALAQVLGMLGNLRLANNLNQLAKSANMGALPVTAEVEEDLGKACAAVLAIKAELMRTLGYSDGGAA